MLQQIFDCTWQRSPMWRKVISGERIHYELGVSIWFEQRQSVKHFADSDPVLESCVGCNFSTAPSADARLRRTSSNGTSYYSYKTVHATLVLFNNTTCYIKVGRI